MKEEMNGYSANWIGDMENKEKRCKVCSCNLIITRKYRFFKHNKGRTYHICLDCEKECEVEWVNVDFVGESPNVYPYGSSDKSYQIGNSTKYEKILSQIEKLRNLLTSERKMLDGLLNRSLDD